MNKRKQLDKPLKQAKQRVRNPLTGELLEVPTFSGKELFWRETNEEQEKS